MATKGDTIGFAMFAIFCLTALSSGLAAQDASNLAAIRQGRKLNATVSVIAFDTNGRFLGSPEVKLFESDDGHKNFASRFHGGVAEGIPYGDYRIEARMTAYSSDSKSVRIYQQHVAVILGLAVSHELPQIPPNLPGRITGHLPTSKGFVRLIGVFANISIDSSIDSEGRFNLAGLSDGKYLLMVIGEGGILTSQPLTVPYTGPPLEIDVGRELTVPVP